MSLGDYLGLGLAGLATGYGLNQAGNIETRGKAISDALTQTGQNLNAGSQFKGYGVTSQLGSTSIGGDGSVNLGVGRDQATQGSMLNAYNAADRMMDQSLTDPAARQQQIYNQAMAVQNPQLDRMQAQQQAREYAMGRGGVRGSLYGGTAEDAAMARARAEASNQAYLMAQQQALAEQGQQAQMATNYGRLANQYNQTQYLPMQTQMQLMQLAGADADRSQTGQLTGQGYIGQMALGGMQTEVNALKAASELRGNVIDSILDNLGGESGLFSFLNDE